MGVAARISNARTLRAPPSFYQVELERFASCVLVAAGHGRRTESLVSRPTLLDPSARSHEEGAANPVLAAECARPRSGGSVFTLLFSSNNDRVFFEHGFDVFCVVVCAFLADGG